jgi:hypothetical protein
VAVGAFAGNTSQGNNAVAVGVLAGHTSQGSLAVAMGYQAGYETQGSNAVAIGTQAGGGGSGAGTDYVSGAVSPSTTLVVVSTTNIVPGMVISGTGFTQNQTVVTVTNATTLQISASADSTPSGTLSFTGSQATSAVAIGNVAGQIAQGQYAVAIGGSAGNTSQGIQAVAIGRQAGDSTQGADAVAVGQGAGYQGQGIQAVAIGATAGVLNQGAYAIAIGAAAGAAGNSAVAIGVSSGFTNQGNFAVAIGASAGATSQGNNSIILNATGAALDQTTANTFTVAPVRNDVANTANVMFYNATSKEITYGNTISVAGNITGGNVLFGSGIISGTGNITGGNITTTGLTSTANLSVTGNTATITTANYSIGYLNVPQISLAANTTIALTDSGKHYYSVSASNLALTIANNTSVSWPIGTAISIVNRGTANIIIAGGTGVSVYLAGNSSAGNRFVTTYGMATVMNVAANIWMINGTVS